MSRRGTSTSRQVENSSEALHLLQYVIDKEDYNKEELDYIAQVLTHVIQKLKKNDEDVVKRINTDLEQQRDCGGCINLDRSGMIIERVLNVTENNRSRQNNRFISAQLQWLCVLLVKFFRFPEVTHADQLTSTRTCQWSFGRKMDNICCNVFHFELKFENCNLSVPNQPSDQTEPTLNFSNSNNLDNLNYAKLKPGTSDSMIRDPDAHSVISYASRQRCNGAQEDNGGVADIVSLRLVEVANRRQVRDPPVQLREEMNQRYRNTLSTSFRKSTELDTWANIQYYIGEHSQGKPFQCSSEENTIIIDGGFNPRAKERFCLNSIGCTVKSEEARFLRNSLNAGGLLLTKVAGMLFIDNNTDRSCFYQSWIGIDMVNDKMETAYHRATVMEVPAKFIGIPLFDLAIFAHDLETAIIRYRDALAERDEAHMELIKQQLERMARRCIIRISLEGYGEQHKFKQITNTRGWLEIKMHKAMIWLDKVKQKFDMEYRIFKQSLRFDNRHGGRQAMRERHSQGNTR